MTKDSNCDIDRHLIDKLEGALIGAAVGDALGWPQEFRSSNISRIKHLKTVGIRNEFQQWTRRAGGRYYPHNEVIYPGEYSDDTQLILCTARSLLLGKSWWKYFSEVEFPTWLLYERGGGGAIKRAAELWLKGQKPWAVKDKNQKRLYLDAGGNGVAMRILPHCLEGIRDSDYKKIARNIIANGACSHGHPRALIGALAYGFALWYVLREKGTLKYGSIIDHVLSGVGEWSPLPDISDMWPTWNSSIMEEKSLNYNKLWEETINEMMDLLSKCQNSMNQGALSVDHETMNEIGCYDRKINGAGTIASATAIFLASRYAADPLNGLFEASFAEGTDTDTIASMTAAILGLINGVDWLSHFSDSIQDSKYLKEIGKRLLDRDSVCKNDIDIHVKRVAKKDTDALMTKLANITKNDNVALPDSRNAVVHMEILLKSDSQKIKVKQWKLIANDGQSLYIKKISRNTIEQPYKNQSIEFPSPGSTTYHSLEINKIGIKLTVRDLVKSRFFYEKVLGLKVMIEGTSFVNFNGVMAIVNWDREKIDEIPLFSGKNVIVHIETNDIANAFSNVNKYGATIVKPITKIPQTHFVCLDPDNNFVQVAQDL